MRFDFGAGPRRRGESSLGCYQRGGDRKDKLIWWGRGRGGVGRAGLRGWFSGEVLPTWALRTGVQIPQNPCRSRADMAGACNPGTVEAGRVSQSQPNCKLWFERETLPQYIKWSLMRKTCDVSLRPPHTWAHGQIHMCQTHVRTPRIPT